MKLHPTVRENRSEECRQTDGRQYETAGGAGRGVYFLVDFYFLSSVFLFCFPCMVGTSTGTACDGSWGNGGWVGYRVQAGAVPVDQALFLPTDGLRYRPGRDHV